MILFHGRWRTRTTLLALDALAGREREATLAHVGACAGCAALLASTRAVLDLTREDPVRGAEPPIPLAALVTRVQARLDERPARRLFRPVAAAAALAIAIAIAAGAFVVRSGVERPVASPPMAAASTAPAVPTVLPAETVRRIETSLERERAARYLSEAGDVLVTVASAPHLCRRKKDAVEVSEEAEKSRELLARRRLFVESDAPSVAPARAVLDDVEEMLRQVAALDPCARPQDLEAIRGEITRRRLLMKIDLVTRELQG